MTVRPYMLIIGFVSFSCWTGEATAQTSSYGELQAAYMYNFAKYITWPDEGQQFIIGVFHDAEIMGELESTLSGKKVRGKAIVLKVVTTIEELAACSIVYLSGSNSGSLGLIVSSIGEKNVLLVTEDDLIRKGAAISFVVEDDKLRFKLKKKSLEKSRLVASDGLLKLAILQ